MRKLWFALYACLVIVSAQPLLAGTYYVGTCKIAAFGDIQTAVNTVPAGSTIDVCPGTYVPSDTLVINKALTLQGVFAGNSSQAVITMPTSGLTTTLSSIATGGTVAAQVEVTSPGVTIKNITVDGSATSCPSGFYIGIFYASGSGGTVNAVETRNQNCGTEIGIVAENGAGASQTITIESSNVNGAEDGIWACSDQTPSTLTADIKGNVVSTSFAGVIAICTGGSSPANLAGSISSNNIFPGTAGLYAQSTLPISLNIVHGGQYGAYVYSGNISSNTFNNNATGVLLAGAASATSNHISNSSGAGIYFAAAGATVKSNVITQTPVGIEFNCFSGTVSTNTINGAPTGLDQVPAAFTGVNTFFNVPTVRIGGAC